MKILLGSKEYIGAVDKDFQFGFGLKNVKNYFQMSEVNKIIDELKQFDLERNSTYDYVLYGKIEYVKDDTIISPAYDFNLDNYDISIGYIGKLVSDPQDLKSILDVTIDYVLLSENFAEINDIILVGENVKRVLDKTEVNGQFRYFLDDMSGISINDKITPPVSTYTRHFSEIYKTSYLNIFNSGYSTNIFKDQIYQYNTFKNINIEGLKDNLNYPITSLFFRITPKFTYRTALASNRNNLVTDSSIVDKVQLNLNDMTYEVQDSVVNVFSSGPLDYYYKPYYDNKIRMMSQVVIDANTSNLFNYPDYGFSFKNGDIVYKQILDIGYFENTNGLDYPFINNLHYVYNDMKIFIRRNTPIADYTNITNTNSDVYASGLVNDEVTTKRLC